MVDVSQDITPGSLVFMHPMNVHRFTQPANGVRRDTYPNATWFRGDQFCGHTSPQEVIQTYMTNRAPSHYAHPNTGNSIPDKWRGLENLVPHIPVYLNILSIFLIIITFVGEVVCDIRPWSDFSVQQMLSIMFGDDSKLKKELEVKLVEDVFQVNRKIVDVQMEFASVEYLKKRKDIANLLNLNLGEKKFGTKTLFEE